MSDVLKQDSPAAPPCEPCGLLARESATAQSPDHTPPAPAHNITMRWEVYPHKSLCLTPPAAASAPPVGAGNIPIIIRILILIPIPILPASAPPVGAGNFLVTVLILILPASALPVGAGRG